MYTGLMIVGGIFWSLTYILVIRRGFKDKTYGIPLAALWRVAHKFGQI